MKYFYTDLYGKICSCVEVFLDGEIPTNAIEWPSDMNFSEATDWHYDAAAAKFLRVDYTGRPSAFHRFNVNTMEWEYMVIEAAQAARNTRDAKLVDLDILVTNPLRWSEFSEAERQQLADYRLALLGVPQQDGFPNNIVWPTPPQ
jgi:hypothetical protein